MMKNKYKIIPPLYFSIVILLIKCVENKQNSPPPPPQLFDGHLCDTFKERSRQEIKNGKIEILFEDTIKEAYKGWILDSIIENNFNLNSFRIFDSNFANCIQPIMDSAIAAKYGINAKDSIINEAYRLTEIVYKKENEK